MKRNLALLFISMVLLAGCFMYAPQGDYGSPASSPVPAPTPAPETQLDNQWNYDNPDVSDYYGYLGSSGYWVSYPSYGYVWLPRDIGYGWRPYSLGRWVRTEFGWTWISVERWGWLVYHYGRWGWDVRLGWFWVPGMEWGPAWVAWRWGDAYVGWAPLPPGNEFIRGYGFRRREFNIPGDSWCFVRGQEFLDPRLDRWILPRERNVNIINYTRMDVNIGVRDNRMINNGVDVDFVERQTNRAVQSYQLRDARRPSEAQVGSRDVALYRPNVRSNQSARPKEVLQPDQAAVRRAEGAPAPTRYTGGSVQNEETAVRQEHVQETQRLENDQRAEMRALQQKAAAERAALRTSSERQKADAAAQAKIAQVQKNHEAEKAQMAQRHKDEEDQVRKKRLRRNEPEKH
jgi:hypothetical protein